MISEKICYATLFVAEALTTWQYVEYLFSKKKPLGFLACSFICGYAILFAVSLLDNTTGNAIVFFIVRAYLKTKYSCTISTKSKWTRDGQTQERTRRACHSE